MNMEGKKKRGGLLIAKPDYKKAYVTLKTPLSISPDLFPIQMIEQEKKRVNKKSTACVIEEGEGKRHWLDHRKCDSFKVEKGLKDGRQNSCEGGVKFPWSGMRIGVGSAR